MQGNNNELDKYAAWYTMPYTQKTGRYYKVVNGKRQYDPRYDRPPGAAARQSVARGPPSRRVLTGQGAYRTKKAPAKKAHQMTGPAGSRHLVEAGGALLGGTLFGPVGAAVGGLAGGALAGFLGLGDYEIKENVFLHGRLPQMINDTPSGGTIIRHQEYLGDVITSTTPGAFSIRSFPLNPAEEQTHPWLAQIAANYEEYEYEGLVFQFRSTSANALNSTNTALGTVMMATNYDAADPLFSSKAEMLNYEFSCSAKPSESLLHMVECAPNQTVLGHRYTRPGLPPAGTDIRFFDLGNFQIATTGFQGSGVNIGELHCTYQVRLLKPKLFVALGNDINVAGAASVSGVSAAAPLGNGTFVSRFDNFGITIAGQTISLPRSQVVETYVVDYFMVGDVAAIIVNPVVAGANLDFSVLSGWSSPQNATTSTTISQRFVFRTRGDGLVPTLTWGGAGTFPTVNTQMRFVINQTSNEAPFP